MSKRVAAAALLAMTVGACGGDLGTVGTELRGGVFGDASLKPASCEFAPQTLVADVDFEVRIVGTRADRALRVDISAGDGTRSYETRSDSAGTATVVASSGAVGSAEARVMAAVGNRFREVARCTATIEGAPSCGDGTCQGGEDCQGCEVDCGVCGPVCGDGACDGTETCDSCGTDCGACDPVCGDGACDAAESCGSCAEDCGVCNGELLWFADHETADLSQYTAGGTYGGSYDSDCIRPPNGVVSSPEPVFNGSFAMKMTAPIDGGKPGCRQFRYEESSLGHSTRAHLDPNPLRFSFWIYLPEDYEVGSWSNMVQIKAKTYSKDRNDAFWVLELRNRPNSDGDDTMYFMLRYKGIYPGPHAGEGTGRKHYHYPQIDFALPARTWVRVEIDLYQSTNRDGQESNYDGRLVVRQDGVEIYDMPDIATRYPDAWDELSINTYTSTNGVTVGGVPTDLTMYVDDFSIERL